MGRAMTGAVVFCRYCRDETMEVRKVALPSANMLEWQCDDAEGCRRRMKRNEIERQMEPMDIEVSDDRRLPPPKDG